MSELMLQSSALPVPVRADVNVRPATVSDLPFMDELQKRHSKQVGWMPTKTLEGKVSRGEVLIAEMKDGGSASALDSTGGTPVIRVGYLIASDRYMKREDVGVVYQINVAPGAQRGFVGATLLKAQFERSAYGCRLYCCWCAQDIEANKFWEAMGFVPLAFRAGSEKKARVHIFWQKRIREGDESTPYWFPSQTTGGSIREDRLVLPIPPGTRWSDAKPMVLPKEQAPTPALPRSTGRGGKTSAEPREAAKPKAATRATLGCALWFTPPAPPAPPEPVVAEGAKAQAKPKREKRKNDPKLVAAARELRDRWLEQVNAPGGNALLPGAGKYDVTRALPGGAAVAELPMAA